MRKIVFAANLAVALALLYLFFSSLNLGELATQLSKTNLVWLAAAIACYTAMNWTSAVRLKKLLSPPISTARTFFIHMQALLLSDVTPGRAGYAYLLVGLRRHYPRLGASARVLGIVLATDFLVRAFLVIALIYLLARGFLAAGVLLAVFSFIALYLFWRRVGFIARVLKKIPFVGERIAFAYESIFVERMGKRAIAYSLFISFLGAVLRGAAWWFILFALGFQSSILTFIVLCALLTSLSFVPLSVAGLGVQEATGAFLFSSILAIPFTVAGSLMILIRVLEAGTDLMFGLKEFVA